MDRVMSPRGLGGLMVRQNTRGMGLKYALGAIFAIFFITGSCDLDRITSHPNLPCLVVCIYICAL